MLAGSFPEGSARVARVGEVGKTLPGCSLPETVFLSWIEEDIENRFGFFKGGRYTSVNKVLSLLLALLLTAGFFLLLVYVLNPSPWFHPFAIVFIRPGNVWTIGPAMLFFFWAVVILCLKSRKIRFQAKALDLAAVPQQPDFILNEATARTVLERIYSLVDHPRHFILLNRIERALSNLQNIGGLSDVSTILKSQAENDENQIASSYTLINGMVWAIPVLGFIGTVQGLSVAIGTFTKTLQSSGDLSAIKANLQGVTSGLATAFETTLVALVAALIIQLFVNFLQQKESDFMDECNDYCHSYVISRLRLVNRAPEAAEASAGPASPAAKGSQNV
ncbi:MAG: MotA/TolQ/ExbB proton channel family protein [Chloroflexi bacterium]|nr:MotA/TolQ/ExbB proton channel family protein [Chloroflexota bacterium]